MRACGQLLHSVLLAFSELMKYGFGVQKYNVLRFAYVTEGESRLSASVSDAQRQTSCCVESAGSLHRRREARLRRGRSLAVLYYGTWFLYR